MLPLLKVFKREFILVGGTAIALHIGHRRSIDFDLFKHSPIRPKSIVNKLAAFGFPYNVTRRVTEQLNVIIHNVTFTFYEYPFPIPAPDIFEESIRIPSLIDLAAMKAYAMERRSKWKDYVDLFFILRDHFTVKEISARAQELFDQLFSEKLFRAQVCFFNDINYSEAIEYMGLPIPEEEIREFLIEKAIDLFN
ncbi:MAG: nucleotidyl transferase AbiEii/AbiGii toxin family protein [Bacteroidota bacterium]